MVSGGFTYEKPDENAFFSILLKYLRAEGEEKIADLLAGARCVINPAGFSFSRKRWNAIWTSVRFYVPIERLSLVNDEMKKKLRSYCDKLMPAEAGYDVMKVEFAPSISDDEARESLVESLDQTTAALSQEVISQLLPADVRERGKEMAEVYLYLYCVENSLRLLIEKVAAEKLGEDFFSKLQLNKGIRENVASRKEEESKNRWLRVRGDSGIFYLDFDDLGTIIQNNWALFSEYFPDQNWIVTKVKELADCRNLVAHNSYVQSHEKDVIRTNYVSILRQLDNVMKKKEN